MAQKDVWTTRGFDAFSAGTCGFAGHNLYVSRGGILQRIHQYDFARDGYLDLVFCNSQDHLEMPPVTLYREALDNPLPSELPADGPSSLGTRS